MSQRKTYLVNGASRGIGLGLAGSILQKPGATLIAAVRDVSKATPALEALPKAADARLIVVKIDSQNDADPPAVVKQLQEQHGLTSIDVVIANAGIAHSGTPVSTVPPSLLREHLEVNTVAPVVLLQAVLPLLKASADPLFLAISTLVGSIAAQETISKMFPAVFAAYGPSKAALNYLIARLHFEETWLTTVAVHPGLVLTDMGSGLVSVAGGKDATGAIDVPTSVGGLLKLTDEATREEYGGQFRDWTGKKLPW